MPQLRFSESKFPALAFLALVPLAGLAQRDVDPCYSHSDSMSFERFLAFIEELNKREVAYVLVGGVALSIHGIVRATEDIDLFVEPEPRNIERLKDALRALWLDPAINQISATDLAAEYPLVRYCPPSESFVIDLLTRLRTFGFQDLEAEIVELDGVAITVATPPTLYRMKAGTGRLIDDADAESLKKKFGLVGEEKDARR